MKRGRVLLMAGGAALIVAVGVWQWAGFTSRTDALREEIASVQKAREAFSVKAQDEASVRERDAALVASTLGGDAETVDARLRAALNQILAACEVDEPVVSARSAVTVRNPATRARELKGLRGAEEMSFATLTGTAQGRGTYEQALAAVATIASQTWAHRVEQVTIKPADKQRQRFDVSVVVTTLFVPDRPPRREEGAPLWAGLDDAAQARLARLTRGNPFVQPPVEVARAPDPIPQPPMAGSAPVGPAYDKWRITALVEGRDGAEMWVEHVGSSERRTVHKGEVILDARFEGAKGDSALVRIGGTVFEVALGRTLADRVQVSQ